MNTRYVELCGKRFNAPQYADTNIHGWVIDQGVTTVEGSYAVRPWSDAEIKRRTKWQSRVARWLWDHLPKRTVYEQYNDGEEYTVTRRPFERRLFPLIGPDQCVSVSKNAITVGAGDTGIRLQVDIQGCEVVDNIVATVS